MLNYKIITLKNRNINKNNIFFLSQTLVNLIVILFAFTSGVCALSQNIKQEEYKVLGLSVEGNSIVEAETILGLAAIYKGDIITYPADDKFQTAIKNLWKRNQFEDVRIVVDKVNVDGVFLKIVVKEFPRLYKINISGYNKLKENEILTTISKTRGDIIKPYELNLIKKRIRKAYFDEGLQFTKVEAKLIPADTNSYVNLEVTIDEGRKFYTKSVEFDGNTHYTNRQLEKVFDDTHTASWWEFWRSAKFNPDKYEEDKNLLEKFYKKNGFMNFRIIKDTLIFDEKKGDLIVRVNIEEGEKFFIRNINFHGNTIYRNENFLARLDMKPGDVMNLEKFEQNLTGNQDQTDALALYMDNGYLQARMEPEYKQIGKDSVDIDINIFENDRFKIGKINIVGNTKTKDKVIRRELFTRPGDFFDRSAVINSIRALGAMNYFNPEALKPDVVPSNIDKSTVDLVYTVEERSNDQANLQVGFAGAYGLTLSMGFVFNNFCLSEPFRAGAGQTVNLSAEIGQSDRYRSFVIGFMEPWLFDRPTTVGFNIFHNMYNYSDWKYNRTGAAINLGRRFKWPDNYFRGDWSVRSQYNDIHKNTSIYYRPGKYWEHTISQTFSRTNWNNAFFPSVGSYFSFSTSWAMGAIGLGNTDFLKNELRYNFVSPLWSHKGSDKVVLYLESRLGYVAGLSSDTAMSASDLFYMGGNDMGMFGVIPLRGYEDNSIGSYYDYNSKSWYSGNQVAAKLSAELRFSVAMDPMPIYVYAFAEAGNLWRDLPSVNPVDMKRSAGVGIQIMMQMLGNIGFSYGYGFDPPGQIYIPGAKPSGWKFLFHLGGL